MQEFNFHSHTYRCMHADLDTRDEEYVQEYIKMGFKKMAFTDHCPEKNEIDTRTDMRMKYSQKEEYLSSIKNLQEKYRGIIEIESGYELEYLPGEEDNIRELKEETDKVILGQHFIYDDNKNLKIVSGHEEFTDEELIRYAEYIEKAVELGIPDIIAHPDLYFMNRKGFGEIEEKVANMICKTAEKYDVPLEINLAKVFNKTYHRDKNFDNEPEEIRKEKIAKISYPNRGFWETVAKYNIRVLYGIDAHHKGQVSRFKKSVELANEIIGEETIKKLNFIENF